MLKPFLSISEQVELLESRGLNIPTKDVAAEFLRRNNYYRVSGYSLTLRDHDKFFENTSFENIIEIYEFDRELRHVLMNYLEIIEVSFKSIYVHEFTRIYGPIEYLNVDNFTDADKYAEILDKTEKLKNSRLPYEAYLKHYVQELEQEVPFWAYIELFYLSDISLLYKISGEGIQKAVAEEFGLYIQGPKLLGKMMHSVTILRNLCAHDSRLFNRFFEQKPKLSKEEMNLLAKDAAGKVDNEHLFSFILVMRRLLQKQKFEELVSRILALSKKHPFVALRYYGFPEGWDQNGFFN